LYESVLGNFVIAASSCAGDSPEPMAMCDVLLLAMKLQLRPQRRVLFVAPFEIPRQLPHPFAK
jgi:hypothetical protein